MKKGYKSSVLFKSETEKFIALSRQCIVLATLL